MQIAFSDTKAYKMTMVNIKSNRTTKFVRHSDVERKWYLIDAEGLVLGRLAAIIANTLRGKHKPCFTPHVDCGDYVVVVNADKVALTGKKLDDKNYYWHTGYPGGLKQRTMKQMLNDNLGDRVINNAVRRMISKGPLQRSVMKRLKVYKGSSHPHEAQSLIKLDVASLNPKNNRFVGK